jgi:hypothetical protein
VRSDPCTTPSSSSTRSESALLVGSTILASTSCSNAGSPMVSNPNRAYTARQDMPEHRGPLPRDHSRPLRQTLLLQAHPVQVERFLPGPQPSTGLSHQHRQLALTARSAYMLKDDIAAGATLRDLNLGAPSATRGLPHEHHEPDTTDPGVCHPDHDRGPDQHLCRQRRALSVKWHESGGNLAWPPARGPRRLAFTWRIDAQPPVRHPRSFTSSDTPVS